MSALRTSLISREVIPFLAALAVLGGTALAFDALLHFLDLVWVGRYLGIAGVILILASSGYSLRKRKLISSGKPANLLRWHEGLAWAGSLLILVHAGIHFNAILAWLAVWAMLINIVSGLTGRFLLKRARARLDANRQQLRTSGLSPAALEEQTYWDSLTFDLVKQWRVVHVPITLAFAALALAHITAVLLFWGWK
ncbi:hypothetical protein BH10PSE14_BH10PSE14_02070 [soil metagenome]